MRPTGANLPEVRYYVTGMDCPSCAAKVERVARTNGVSAVKVSTATQIMTLQLADAEGRMPQIESAIRALGYELTPLAPACGSPGGRENNPLAHLAPAYRRALSIVVLLNIGYGVVEMVGGFLADSQALKADALDFIGDGLITFLGFLAIGWALTWRACSAMLQGIFLGLLGLAVVGATIFRTLVQRTPEAELMGLMGLVALLVNLAAAGVLVPHRNGDANVRAVWLFSRNDALGNAAVVVAAGFVAWTGHAWPDLLVAFMIAVLFLHSACVIIRDARQELRRPT